MKRKVNPWQCGPEWKWGISSNPVSPSFTDNRMICCMTKDEEAEEDTEKLNGLAKNTLNKLEVKSKSFWSPCSDQFHLTECHSIIKRNGALHACARGFFSVDGFLYF